MFRSLIEAIVSEVHGMSMEKTPNQGMNRGKMADDGQKKADMKADRARRRRMGKLAAQDTEEAILKPHTPTSLAAQQRIKDNPELEKRIAKLKKKLGK